MIRDNAAPGPLPIHDPGEYPPRGPIIDVEPVHAEPPEPPPAPDADHAGPAQKFAITPWLGVGGLALIAAIGVALLVFIPWRTPQDQAGFRQQVADRLSGLDQRLAALENKPVLNLPADLEGRLSKLEAVSASAATLAAKSDLDALQARLAQLETRLLQSQEASATLTARIAALQAGDVAQTSRIALLALASGALDDAIREGRGFRNELALVQRFRPDDAAIVRLEPFAESGIESIEALARAFPAYAQAAQATLAAQDKPQGFWDGIVKFFSGFVTVRDSGVAANAPASETLNAMRLALTQGDLAGAVGLKASLPQAAQTALAPWVARAQAHLFALDAARALRQRMIDELAAATATPAAPPASRP